MPFVEAPFKGVVGSWLSPPVANRVFFLLTECMPSLKTQVQTNKELAARALQLAATATTATAVWKDIATEEQSRGDEYRKELLDHKPMPSVWDGPLPWFALGMVLGVAAVVGVSYSLPGANP